MIKNISIENVGVFKEKQSFDFSQNVNVVLGKNGTGKSILLKFLYSSMAFLNEKKESENKEILNHKLSEKIKNVFLIEKVGKLTTRTKGANKSILNINLSNGNLSFSFSTRSTKVNIDRMEIEKKIGKAIFIPTREILSLMNKGLIGIYQSYKEPFMEEVYYDLAKKLDAPIRKGRNENKINELLNSFKIEDINLGIIYRDPDSKDFIAYIKGTGNIESKLLAEGYRKIETLIYLLKNGQLTNNGFLFWDEPESNLNPSLMKSLVDFILNLSVKFKIQVFLSTHNYFLLKYLDLKNKEHKPRQIKFFSLTKKEGNIVCSSSDDIYKLDSNEIIEEFENILKNETFLII